MSGVSIMGSSDQNGSPDYGEQTYEATRPATTGQSAPLPPATPAMGASAPAPSGGQSTDGDAGEMGPSVARGAWLDEPEHWLTTGNHQIPRPRVSQQTLQRPKRFHHVPRWVSAAVLAAVLVGAVVTGILMVHAAGTVIPRHPAQPTAAPTHHAATPTHKAAPAH